MMRKKCFIGIMVALCLSLFATSCSKEDKSTQEVITENFKALVMGGKDIDPKHTWSTATTMPVNVNVNMDAGVTYNVYFFLSNPITDTNAHYVGMGSLASGESKTIYITKPVDATQVYTACYGPNGKAICMPVTKSEITFSGTISSEPTSPNPTMGNNWSVPIKNMPDVTKYTSGNLIDVNDVNPDFPETAETHIKISSDYNGILPYLTNHSNISIYVTGTWTLTFDQRFINGNVLVVGNGGKVVIPKGFKLSTSPLFDTQKPGVIYVLPGGEISGEGVLELTDGNDTYSYNAGSIINNEIDLHSGSLYNSGSIGDGSNTSTTLYGEATSNDTPGQLFNYGTAYLMQTSGSALGISNANYIKVLISLSLSSVSRMDDGSVIECSSLALQGSATAKSVLYMGNRAYLNCSGSINVSNYGVWGPSGDNYHDNALFRAGSCSKCTVTPGNAYSYMLDHVQIHLPASFQGLDMIANWVNGGESDISSDRQTCFYAMDYNKYPEYGGMYYAFEFPGDNSIRDFDYNDVVLLASTPYDNGDGTYSCFLSIACVGTKLNTYLIYNGEQIGEELHKHMNIDEETTINTNSVTVLPRYIGEIKTNSSNIAIGSLKFTIRTEKTDGSSSNTYSQPSTNDAPLHFAVNADTDGKWRWPREGTNIGLAFLKFSTWASNQQEATDWHTYPVITQVVSN